MQGCRSCIDRRHVSAYRPGMRRHTTIDLDDELVGAARQVLGTRTTTETVHAALAEVVRRRRRLEILELRPAHTLADLAAMRAHRFAEEPVPFGPADPEP